MFAGRRFADRSAVPLTLLNFSWSLGAFLAPLLAARVLMRYNYRTAYEGLAMASAAAAIACLLGLEDNPGTPAADAGTKGPAFQLRWIALFALLTFLEVGIENTTATWLATFTLRSSHGGTASAAASTSFYWCGFLASRGLSWLVLLGVDARRVLQMAVILALGAAALLVGLNVAPFRDAAMFALGASLAPIFPLLLARFFAGADNTDDSRWMLATCGFGGSVLPWITGWISGASHSLRLGLTTVPAALLLMILLLTTQRTGSVRIKRA
jgi:MFS transporter, FHS family, glucose/mannose:H+ symporter